MFNKMFSELQLGMDTWEEYEKRDELPISKANMAVVTNVPPQLKLLPIC